LGYGKREVMETESIYDLLQGVKDGEINPLEAYIILKNQQTILESALKQVQEQAIDEGLKYGEKSFSAYGAKVEMRSAPAVYKFDETVQQFEARLKAMKDQSKIGSFVDPDTGVEINKAVKIEGKQTISISFK
jgi:hypothetical protein